MAEAMAAMAGEPGVVARPIIERASPSDRAFLAMETRKLPVCFEALSYAGTLTITAIIDPGHFPDSGTLADALHTELGLITHQPSAGVAP